MANILGIGGANVDMLSRSSTLLRLRDSNPSTIRITPGGVCRNVCENLARLGESVNLITAIGDDAFGRTLREKACAAGLDMAHTRILHDAPTGIYLCVLDDAGDMLVAMSDMEILEHGLDAAFIRSLHPVMQVHELRACVVDANLAPDALLAVAEGCAVPLFADPVSCAKAVRLLPVLDKLHTIKPNRMELEVLTDMRIADDAVLPIACGALLKRGVKRVVVSLGEHGMYLQDAQGQTLHRNSRPLRVRNATGAGDAALAGLIYAFIHGLAARETLNFAIAASLAALDCDTTINPALCPALVRTYSKEYLE